MANIIDIFNASKLETSKLTGSSGLFQSEQEIVQRENLQNKFISNVDYSSASNFARFGSAEEYYKNAINYIISDYPTDGSTADKLKWTNELSEFEYYIYKNEYPRAVGHVALSSSQYIHISKSLRDNTQSAKTAFNELNKNVNSTYLDISDGLTYEVWAKLNSNTSTTVTLLSASNGTSGIKLDIYLNTTPSLFQSLNTNISGTPETYTIPSTFTLTDWNRYSFVLTPTETKFFINGELQKVLTRLTPTLFSGSCEFKILPDSSNSLHLKVDDARLWNTERSAEKIGKFWFLPVDGNDTTDDSLVFNLKFNEGIDSTNQYASTCIDYSGRQNDGVIAGYVSNVRSSTSAFDESGLVDDAEVGDPITVGRSLSTTLSNYYNTKIEAGQSYDYENTNALYKKFPSWILEAEEEQETKHLKQVIQIVSSYFDDLYNKISEVNKYKTQQFQTDSDKIYPFYDKILSSTGFDFTELFSSLEMSEKIGSRTEDNIFNKDIQKVKNSIYQNIYNNLAYILKSKGTEKSIQSFLRSYGIDDNLVRVNLYGNDYEYKLLDTSKSSTIKKKVIDFAAYPTSSVYLSSSLVSSADKFSSITLEGSFIFPSSSASSTAGQKYSLFGFHTPNSVSDLTWNAADADISVYAQKDATDVNKIKFSVSSSYLALNLTSSDIYDVYDNSVWNIAVKIKPVNNSETYPVSSSGYILEMYGVSHKADSINKEFLVSSSFSDGNFLEDEKSVYVGAHRTNFSGSVLNNSDVKALYVNYWNFYLEDETIAFHNKDLTNYGTSYPTKKLSLVSGDVDQNSSLALSWNFDTVTGSDGSGKFEVVDTANANYGKGTGFPASTSSFVYKEYLQTNKQLLPETLNGNDTIYVLSEDDQEFNKTLKRPQSLRLMVENSMYQIMSDEMLNAFGTIVSFNNLIGEGHYKYSAEYNELNTLRKQFFSKIQNKPSIEKYMEFYKWLDSSLGLMLDQLKPENSKASSGLKTTIESYMLERNKYKHILPSSFVSAKVHTASVSTTPSLASSTTQSFYTDTIADIVSIENTSGKNYNFNYEIVQTAGKKINNRGTKTNKTVVQTRFSTADGLSEANRDESGEMSIYNSLLNKSQDVRISYNQAVAANTTSNSDSYTQDNGFITRNIPASASNWYSQDTVAALTGNINYQLIPSSRILSQRLQNSILSVKEPVTQHSPTMKHTGRVAGALTDIVIQSPYTSKIGRFANQLLEVTSLDDSDTFYRKAKNITGSFETKTTEYLEQIFPRKTLEGLAATRTKPNFEEIAGTGSNGYDRNSGEIRIFWKDGIDNRLRTRGADLASKTGSINCMNYPNYSASAITIQNTVLISGTSDVICDFRYKNNHYNCLYSMDSSILTDIDVQTYSSGPLLFLTARLTYVEYSGVKSGDLSPITTPERVKTILSQSISVNNTSSQYTSYNNRIQPRPTFIFTNYPSYSFTSESVGGLTASFRQNFSYSSQSYDFIPAYNSYTEYFANIKHKSQNYSIIPEFMIGNHESIITGGVDSYSYTESYLKILGREQFSQITSSNFVTDTLQVKQGENPTKLKIKLKGIKKLLPYNGFYPQQRTVQIVDLFQKSYFDVSQSQITGTHYVNSTTKTPLDQQIQTIIQPLFAPGILFNSIKAGVAVDFPIYANNTPSVYTTKPNFYESCSLNDVDKKFYILDSESTHRVQFEAILDPSKGSLLARTESNGTTNDNYLYYLDPTHYSTALVSSSTAAYPVVSLNASERGWNKFDNNTEPKLYTYAIHNFLAETVKFFLKDESLTKFESKPFETITLPDSGSYKMEVTISKNKNFSMFKNYGNSEIIVPRSSLFGPPMRYWENDITNAPYAHTAALQDPAYAAYAPPYMIGNTTTIVEFSGSAGTTYNIDQIIQNLTYSTSNPEIDSVFSAAATNIGGGGYSTSPAYRRKMDLTPCMNFNQIVEAKTETFDINGRQIDSSTNSRFKKWVIETKFESPLIDYSDEELTQEVDSVEEPTGTFDVNKVTNTKYFLSGIWGSKGSIPKDRESVQLTLDDSKYRNKSLAKLLGFRPETKSIGVLAETKQISEMLLLIPYKLLSSGEKKYFNVFIDKVNKILNVPNYKILSIQEIKQRLESDSSLDENNSLVKLMRSMVKYNIPPHMNWLNDKTISPFVMIVAEFKHTLTKQDLADIWQGDLPEIGTTPEEEEVIIEESLDKEGLFEGAAITSEVKFDVFKVKLRASNNYYDITSGEEQNKPEIPFYSYNWPYDFFSLVELVNIEAGYVVEKREPVSLEMLASGGTVTLDQVGIKSNLTNIIAAAISGS